MIHEESISKVFPILLKSGQNVLYPYGRTKLKILNIIAITIFAKAVWKSLFSPENKLKLKLYYVKNFFFFYFLSRLRIPVKSIINRVDRPYCSKKQNDSI